MVVPDALAVVVRQRGGPNLIVHTRGMSGNTVSRACEEAVTIMGRFAAGRGETDIDGSGHIHPKFSHDKLFVMDGRSHFHASKLLSSKYCVVYRLVFKVWIMAVAPVTSSTFTSVRLVEAATKGLVTTCQGLEVDQDVLMRNYPEAHFMLGAVLNHQGANLQQAQADALANIYSMIADSKDKKKGSQSDGAKKLSSVSIPCPKLEDFGGSKEGFNFAIPSDFKSQKLHSASIPSHGFPTFIPAPAPVPGLQPTAKQQSFNLGDLLQESVQPVAPSAPLEGLDDFFAAVTPTKSATPDLLPSVSPIIPAFAAPEKSSDIPPNNDWFAFGTSPEKPVFPVQTIPKVQGPLLFLMEIWQGKFEAGKCCASKASGEVNLRKEVWKMHSGKELNFKLMQNKNQDSKCLNYALKCSTLNASRAKAIMDQEGVFKAKIQPAKFPILKYKLLQGCYEIPLKVHITSGLTSYKEKDSLVVMVHLMSNPKNPSLASGSVVAWIPQLLGCPQHARPCPQFSKRQNCLKWTFQRLLPNQNALFKLVFSQKNETIHNLEELSKSIRVEVNAIGNPGHTFSGLSMAQELIPSASKLSETPCVCTWAASLTARP